MHTVEPKNRSCLLCILYAYHTRMGKMESHTRMHVSLFPSTNFYEASTSEEMKHANTTYNSECFLRRSSNLKK